jgi:hypothetical protein
MSARPATARGATTMRNAHPFARPKRTVGLERLPQRLASPNHCRRLGKRPETGADEAASNPTPDARRQQFVLTMPKRASNEIERHRLCPREDGVDNHLHKGCVVPQPIQLALFGGGQCFNGWHVGVFTRSLRRQAASWPSSRMLLSLQNAERPRRGAPTT